MRWSLLPALLAAILLMLVGTNARTYAQENTAASDETQLVNSLRSEGAKVHRHGETDRVRFIGFARRDALGRPAGLPADAAPETAARAYMAKYGKLFGLTNQSQELRARLSKQAGDRSVVKFQQRYKNVPVLGGEINVELDGANRLLVATGEILPGIDLGVEPGVGAAEARETAIGKIAKDRDLEEGELKAAEPELWIYDPTIFGGPGAQIPRLVWRTEVTPAEGLVDLRELVLVDARIGAVVLSLNQIDTARDRRTHTANSTSTLPGTLVCAEADACNAPTLDADVVAAHRYAGDTYNFYGTNHGRDSIDNAGMPMISTVDYCPDTLNCPYQNAFWNGAQMVYGDGFAAADDVVSHELTHGVTDFESSLFYYYQSGAINESFSDIWGEFVDLTNGSGTDTAAVRWKMGEDIPGFGAIRDMRNPTVFGDPDRMTSPLYFADANEQDNGGVHINSGVGNKAAYLMTDGAAFNGRTVTGIGIGKVAKIYYEAQTNLLTSASDYQDLYSALQQACANLSGTAGITPADCAEVKDAVDATQMNVVPPNAPNPEAPVCAPGQTPTDLFFDDLENTASGNWVRQTVSGTQSHWYYPQNSNPFNFDATYATSGVTNFWGYDYPATADYAIAKATGVAVPAGKTTYLRFRHSYGFEDDSAGFYDGGVLEYSTNNGATWNDAGPLIVNNGYKGTVDNRFGNPLGGRRGFVGESNGYISSRVNFSSLAGQNVRFRFRIGTDSAFDDFGWFVDDVRVYTCPSVAPPPDTTRPTVTSVSPTGKRVSPKANVVAGFSERMRAGTLNKATVKLVKKGASRPVAARVIYNSATRKVTLNPARNLVPGAIYKATITTGAKDLAGNPLLRAKVWSFKIKPRR